MAESFDIVVAGGGAAGLACALLLARRGWRVALVGPRGTKRDGRTVALMDSSMRILEQAGAGGVMDDVSAPLASLCIIDDTGSLLRAPPVTFHAAELELDCFGRNIEAATLVERLSALVDGADGITRIDDSVAELTIDHDGVTVRTDRSRELTARLVVGADGRRSPVREGAGIGAREWRYDQSALTCIFAHDRDHRDTSTEFHTRTGPFTLVPLPGRRSSLVWLTAAAEAERLAALDNEAFALAAEKQAHSLLGRMRVDGPRGLVPMGGLAVERFTATRRALVGEAAHVFPPIGAQGLNLGLRDAADLARAVGRTGGDPGSPEALAAYERSRAPDVRMRTMAVDALNRSLLAGFLPVDALRGAGLMALSSIGPLRRMVMRQGLGSAP
jgi:2-octaprenyl-6-methoxyphenol hydroxylase